MSADDVRAAAERLRGIVVRTPLERNARLSELVGAEVWLKREDLQPVRSYKLRGAYNFIASLGPADRVNGVICASAGNHGQGVAYTCRRMGVR
ncbi:MAG: pyridoxal-phosphate dependent enzyme, partial [Actinomycetota bacterium]|nr:pyridoxal-phosphate dependent enzyme [Actinomycetota bacterium]